MYRRSFSLLSDTAHSNSVVFFSNPEFLILNMNLGIRIGLGSAAII